MPFYSSNTHSRQKGMKIKDNECGQIAEGNEIGN